jgi:cytosine/adenosine deaminase-related metal-dependent hydrolase
VHCCALEDGDIELIKTRGANVAHCPRSNAALGCPPAPVRELLSAGIKIGLGLDSAASSGPIDMFAEMRAALATSIDRSRPLSGEEVWRMATVIGAQIAAHAGVVAPNWNIQPGSSPPLIKIHVPDAYETEQIIERAHPGLVEWV